jgi:membrane protein implicated in regulation of membrane protease activity
MRNGQAARGQASGLPVHRGGTLIAERDESELERLDRNTVELLNELRVASTGIQVLFAFLLVVPFNTGFSKLTSFDRYCYFVTLLCIAVAAALLIAPSIHHRLLFRQKEKDYVVRVGTRLAIISGVFLTAGLTGILVLIADVVFSGATAAVVGGFAAVTVATLWFGMPLRHRRRVRQRTRG